MIKQDKPFLPLVIFRRKNALAVGAALAVIILAGACKKTVTFGVVADVQYHAGKPLGTRNYSASLDKLKEAVVHFNEAKVRFVVNLGDTIDHDLKSFDAVMPLFNALKAPVYHVVGNHDFSVETNEEKNVLPALGLKESYYAFSKGNWLFVVLDGFELRFPFPENETLSEESEALYTRLRAEGKEHAQRWNGGIGSKQLDFLEDQLKEADTSGKKAIIFCHFPVLPESSANLWNDAAVIALLEKHPAVKAYFCGHNHAGDYIFQNGIHYLTFQGMVETPDQNAFAIVALEKDVIRVQGFGREPSRALDTDARLSSGNAFALRGLMDRYEDTGEKRFLEAARRLGRYFQATFETWKEKGEGGPIHEFYGYCLDGLVKLYMFGGDEWALDLAKSIGERARRTIHTHHSLSLYRGVIDLYRVSGGKRFLDKAADYFISSPRWAPRGHERRHSPHCRQTALSAAPI